MGSRLLSHYSALTYECDKSASIELYKLIRFDLIDISVPPTPTTLFGIHANRHEMHLQNRLKMVGRMKKKKTKRKRERNIVNASTQSYFRVGTHTQRQNVLFNLG